MHKPVWAEASILTSYLIPHLMFGEYQRDLKVERKVSLLAQISNAPRNLFGSICLSLMIKCDSKHI